MRISAPGRFERGITLIEVLAVMVIIALTTSLALLSLAPREGPLDAEARRLANQFRALGDDAAARGARLLVSPAGNRLTSDSRAEVELSAHIEKIEIEGREVASGTPLLFAPEGGPAFSLTLEKNGARFTVARDSLGRIAVRAGG